VKALCQARQVLQSKEASKNTSAANWDSPVRKFTGRIPQFIAQGMQVWGDLALRGLVPVTSGDEGVDLGQGIVLSLGYRQ
jgi:hypothetical protein